MTKPWSIYRRAEVESQEEAIDDRTAVQKLPDACWLVLDTKGPTTPYSGRAELAAQRAFADLVYLINEQFGDEVDVELLAKALAS